MMIRRCIFSLILCNGKNQLQNAEHNQANAGGNKKAEANFSILQSLVLFLLILPTHIEPSGAQQTDKGGKDQPDHGKNTHSNFLLCFFIVYRKKPLSSRFRPPGSAFGRSTHWYFFTIPRPFRMSASYIHSKYSKFINIYAFYS